MTSPDNHHIECHRRGKLPESPENRRAEEIAPPPPRNLAPDQPQLARTHRHKSLAEAFLPYDKMPTR